MGLLPLLSLLLVGTKAASKPQMGMYTVLDEPYNE